MLGINIPLGRAPLFPKNNGKVVIQCLESALGGESPSVIHSMIIDVGYCIDVLVQSAYVHVLSSELENAGFQIHIRDAAALNATKIKGTFANPSKRLAASLLIWPHCKQLITFASPIRPEILSMESYEN